MIDASSPLTEQEEQEWKERSALFSDMQGINLRRALATLDALRARLAQCERERDRYRLDYLLQRNRADRMTREAMAAADCIESEGWSDHEAKVSTYRAIRAENVKAEGEKA